MLTKWLRKKEDSKEIGKNRLQLILIDDRLGVSHETLDSIKDDIFTVISKYFDVSEDDVEMNLQKEDGSVALVASIPVLGMKRQSVTTK
ncbi:cell division topological specificity factor MinE [Candidatus Poribacteria bacterium]|nr:cell division topological specificity factor MinE [Candidatus Poribacteria bacterium]